jgi:hypothetical protein
MNPIFSGDPNRPLPGTGSPTMLNQLASTGGDPTLSGGNSIGSAGGRVMQRPATGGSAPVAPTPRPRPTGLDRYFGSGNIGQSQAGSTGPFRYNPVPTDNNNDYPWMQDQSIQWGGGPHGYLPLDYQPQNFDYYAQGNYGSHLAPWEYKYWKDTWTQNYDPNAPGFANTRNPAVLGASRG